MRKTGIVLLLMLCTTVTYTQTITIHTQEGEFRYQMTEIDSMAVIPSPLTDIDGNTYEIVKIGNQVWMAENLKVTHYRNGDAIPYVTDDAVWDDPYLYDGGYCHYNDDESYAAVYGLLYNWHAVHDYRGLAPEGWHVPSDEEWKELEMSLGMSQASADSMGWRGMDVGGKLKQIGTDLWAEPNIGATNISGFTALPGGYRSGDGFFELGRYALFWTSTGSSSLFRLAIDRGLRNSNSKVFRYTPYNAKSNGLYVRCVKDSLP